MGKPVLQAVVLQANCNKYTGLAKNKLPTSEGFYQKAYEFLFYNGLKQKIIQILNKQFLKAYKIT